MRTTGTSIIASCIRLATDPVAQRAAGVHRTVLIPIPRAHSNDGRRTLDLYILESRVSLGAVELCCSVAALGLIWLRFVVYQVLH